VGEMTDRVVASLLERRPTKRCSRRACRSLRSLWRPQLNASTLARPGGRIRLGESDSSPHDMEARVVRARYVIALRNGRGVATA
jgi:hypothetical protein